MRIQDIIAKKRDGAALTPDEITWFVDGYTRGDTIADYQASALLMAIYLRGMNETETALLTAAMAASGQTLDLSHAIAPGVPTLDKHSTGGVGDKTTLVVVPILAAAGVAVCKMSGRGLGHTGGTLDKLESIPGFRVDLTPDEMVRQVATIGACLAGQTGDLAPADKKLYALRDATATVGSLPLIVGSILSKKLAGGAAAFLFDVKVGGGALMKTPEEATALAEALVAGAVHNGRRAVAVLSDMSQPLGNAVGNALEIREAMEALTPGAGGVNARFQQLCLRLAAEGLLLAGRVRGQAEGQAEAARLIESGAGWEKFRQIVQAQGGDSRIFDDPQNRLPVAPVLQPVPAPRGGWVAAVDAEAIGNLVVQLGGGRARKEDLIDPAVGLILQTEIGHEVQKGAPLATIHARTEAAAEAAAARLQAAYQIRDEPVPMPQLLLGVLGRETPG
ncbi:MAG: thymidine phosphorylase [Cytophagales bacterium]|nr:thymidine phosphorylase [Armatimonadota bacterium]